MLPSAVAGVYTVLTKAAHFSFLCDRARSSRVFLLLIFTMADSDPWVSAFATGASAGTPPTLTPNSDGSGVAGTPASLSQGVTIVSGISQLSLSNPGSHVSSARGVGISGEYGGVAKRATLFSVDTAVSPCLGFVGAGNKRFCTKIAVQPSGSPQVLTCGVGKHAVKIKPRPGTFYLRGNDASAFCAPSLPRAMIPIEFRENFNTQEKTLQEWKQLFEFYAASDSMANKVDTAEIFEGAAKLSLKTPKKLNMADEVDLPVFPMPAELLRIVLQDKELNANEFWWEEEDSVSLLPSSLLALL